MAPSESSSVTASRRGLVTFGGRDGDRTVVWLRGEHDVSTVAALSQTMARATALDDADLVVDLSEVQFMDASTVGVIIRTREFLRQRSRSLLLRSPSAFALRILGLCGLAALLDPCPVEATPPTGTAGALGTWVAVPATDRVDPRADASAPEDAPDPVPVRRGTAAKNVSSADAPHLANKRTTTLAGRGEA